MRAVERLAAAYHIAHHVKGGHTADDCWFAEDSAKSLLAADPDLAADIERGAAVREAIAKKTRGER